MSDRELSPEDQALCDEADAFLIANWDRDGKCCRDDPSSGLKGFMQRAFEARWCVLTWPEEWWGRGLSVRQSRMILRVFRKHGAVGPGQDLNNIAVSTVYAKGQEAFKRRILPELITGGYVCLLYSEPGAGSDLAAIRTRADKDGDDYIINGQKVWTSGAMTADYAMLIARTDWDAPKHKGISFFLFPMKQPGVDVRPLHQITDDKHFNEVFIDNARVPAENMLGELNDGFKVLTQALAVERLIMGDGATERRMTGFAKHIVDLIDLARKNDKINDPVIRERIAKQLAWRQLNSMNLVRAKEEIAQQGSSSLMSISKLAMSRMQHGDAQVMADILGPKSLIMGDDHPDEDYANYRAAHSFMNSIGGGTDQIQRNIIAERILGLPKEIEVDRALPFKEVKSG
jgi:alkylation response protein AidB-like acyl-CoA dehydrogenase